MIYISSDCVIPVITQPESRSTSSTRNRFRVVEVPDCEECPDVIVLRIFMIRGQLLVGADCLHEKLERNDRGEKKDLLDLQMW